MRSNVFKRCIFLIVLLAPFGLALADDDWQRYLDQARERASAPAMGLLLVEAGKPPLIRVSGVREVGSGVAVEVDDPWHIGSNAKAMTAMLVASLAEQGRIEWNDRLGDVLADDVATIHPGWRQVSYGHLLSHCSGLPANPSRWMAFTLAGLDRVRDPRADRLVLFSNLLGDAPQSTPGEEFEYSNVGYMAVAAMLEATLDASYESLLGEHVLGPLGMTAVGFGPPGRVGDPVAPKGHVKNPLGGLVAVEFGMTADNPPAMNPAGRLHMPLADYARFLQDWLSGLSGEGGQLTPDSYQRLIAPGCAEDYAAGWSLADGVLQHNGSNTMWLARVEVDPEAGRAAVVVSNSGDIEGQRPVFQKLARDLLDGVER